MGILQKARDWLNSLGGSGGGKRPTYRSHTDDGQEIILDSQETIIGNNEATAFFTDVCGGSLKDVMLRAGATNIPLAVADASGAAAEGPAPPGRGKMSTAQMDVFRKYGVRVSPENDVPIYVKPGTYPHVDLDGGSLTQVPEDGRPLVISSDQTDKSKATHATVVFTVFDTRRSGRYKQATVHFHGRGVIRAKGFTREIGSMGRPTHYDGEEVHRVIRRKARAWGKKIHWCSASERY